MYICVLFRRKKNQLFLREFQFRGEILLLLHLPLNPLGTYYKRIFSVVFLNPTWMEIDGVFLDMGDHAMTTESSAIPQ
jgi:hypothetical protein